MFNGKSRFWPLAMVAITMAYQSGDSAGQQKKNGPVAHWTFDKPRMEGVEIDESDHGQNAKIHGAVWRKDGIMGGALLFDGRDDFVEKAFDPKSQVHPTGSPFTVCAWFKTASDTPQEQTILSTHHAGSGYDGYKFTIDNRGDYGGKLLFMIGAGKHHVLSTKKPCNDGRWHHVTGIWDGRIATLYLDGELQRSLETTGTIPYSHRASFTIGHSKNSDSPHARNSSYFFKGAIDDVRFYDRMLSKEEIDRLARRP